jgi:hypothetical protein
MRKDLVIFLLALVAVFALILLWPTPVAQTADVEVENSGETEETISRFLLKLEGEWEPFVNDNPGITTTEGYGYIEKGRLHGKWHDTYWAYDFPGGSKLHFRDEVDALYVDITFSDGGTETITLTENK